MKPLKLTITAFGPYKDTEIIDFQELGEHRLFAISGKTVQEKQPFLMPFVMPFTDQAVVRIVRIRLYCEVALLMMIFIQL